jgi:hypothetical protein
LNQRPSSDLDCFHFTHVPPEKVFKTRGAHPATTWTWCKECYHGTSLSISFAKDQCNQLLYYSCLLSWIKRKCTSEERCTPMEYMYFSKAFSIILHDSLALMFITAEKTHWTKWENMFSWMSLNVYHMKKKFHVISVELNETCITGCI